MITWHLLQWWLVLVLLHVVILISGEDFGLGDGLTIYPKSQGGGRQEVPRVNFGDRADEADATQPGGIRAQLQILESFSPVFNHGSDITPVSLHLDMPCSWIPDTSIWLSAQSWLHFLFNLLSRRLKVLTYQSIMALPWGVTVYHHSAPNFPAEWLMPIIVHPSPLCRSTSWLLDPDDLFSIFRLYIANFSDWLDS